MPETPQTQWYSSVQTDLCIFPPKLLLLLGAFLSVRHHQPPRLRAQRSGGGRGQSAGEQTGQDSPFRGHTESVTDREEAGHAQEWAEMSRGAEMLGGWGVATFSTALKSPRGSSGQLPSFHAFARAVAAPLPTKYFCKWWRSTALCNCFSCDAFD